ncbi:MAG: hypothetical protein Q7U78_03845 [Gallionella sp.]|nr:hypothetical protein [Gallionella sp.]
MLLPQRKTYKGIVQLQGGSIKSPGKDTRKFSTIRIGQQELHNIEVPQYFERLLVRGEEIELTLTRASFASFIFAIVSGILYFTGKMSDFSELVIIGPIVFVVSTFYWLISFINSGHGIYSIKANNKLYRGNEDVRYEAAVSPATHSSVGVQYEASAPPITRQPEITRPPEKVMVYPLVLENSPILREGERSEKSDLSTGFNSRIPGVSKLACPQCDTEALVVPETNIICGDCKVLMQVEKS